MFGKLIGNAKQAALKKLIQKQLKDMPKDQADMLQAMVEKDPELFMKMAQEAQALVKGGKDQMTAMMEVGKKYQKELQRLMQ